MKKIRISLLVLATGLVGSFLLGLFHYQSIPWYPVAYGVYEKHIITKQGEVTLRLDYTNGELATLRRSCGPDRPDEVEDVLLDLGISNRRACNGLQAKGLISWRWQLWLFRKPPAPPVRPKDDTHERWQQYT